MTDQQEPGLNRCVSRRLAFAGAAAAVVGAAEVVRAGDADAAVQGWSTAGNTVDAGSFVGTKNVQPLIFKTAATANAPIERLRIAPAGGVAINSTSTTANLTVGASAGNIAVRVANHTTTGTGAGLFVNSDTAPGVSSTNAAGNAIVATQNAADGVGAAILVQSKTATGINVINSVSGTAVYATTAGSTAISGQGNFYGVSGTAISSSGYGGYFSGGTLGSYASGGSYGAYGYGGTYGVYGSSSGYGVYGNNGTSANYGVYGTGGQYAVAGNGGVTAAVRGDNGYVGGWFQGGSYALYALSTATSGGYGVFGENPNANGYAIYSKGNCYVQGTLSKAAGSFKIDHPLDPTNKWLSHSFVESPDMMNVYNGNVTLNSSGNATVTLPSYFNALNREYRYQLTCIGAHADVFIAEEVSGNSFKIGGGIPGLKVSWQVTGIRQDEYAKAHPIVVETAKVGEEVGTRAFVPSGSKGKVFTEVPKAAALKRPEVQPLKKPSMDPTPKPGIGQNWVPPNL